MKKLLSILISITLLFNVIPAFTVNAATYGKFYYEIDYHGIDPYIRIIGYDTSDFSSERILEIPSEIDGIPVEEIGYQALMGDIATGIYSLENIRKTAYFNKFEIIILPDSINVIGSQAFANCFNLKYIVIPDSVTTIASDAFLGHSNLTIYGEYNSYAETYAKDHYISFSQYGFLYDYATDENGKYAFVSSFEAEDETFAYIPKKINGVYIKEIKSSAFSGCRNITDIIMTDSIERIGSMAFSQCTSLSNIKLSNSLKRIENMTFHDCESLKEIQLPSSIEYIGESAFNSCYSLESIEIPYKVQYISNNVFSSCKKLKSITLPNNVVSIGDRAFMGCTELTEVQMSDNVTYIGTDAFRDCAKLNNIGLSNKLVTIGGSAFRGCSCIKNLEIPKSVLNIGSGAFTECTNLNNVNYGGTNYAIDKNYEFSIDNKKASITCYLSNVRNVTVPDKILGCDVICISDFSFAGKALTSISLPNSITSISKGSFLFCENLASVKLSTNLVSIDDAAFSTCKNLKNITIYTPTTQISDTAFYDCNSLTIICPKGSYAETYAKNNGIPFEYISTLTSAYSKKDFDNDGYLSIMDVSMIQNRTLDEEVDAEILNVFDINANGKLDLYDTYDIYLAYNFNKNL